MLHIYLLHFPIKMSLKLVLNKMQHPHHQIHTNQSNEPQQSYRTAATTVKKNQLQTKKHKQLNIQKQHSSIILLRTNWKKKSALQHLLEANQGEAKLAFF